MSNPNSVPPTGNAHHHYNSNYHKNRRNNGSYSNYSQSHPQPPYYQQQGWTGYMTQPYQAAAPGYAYSYYAPSPQGVSGGAYYAPPPPGAIAISPTLPNSATHTPVTKPVNLSIKNKNGEAVQFNKGHSKTASLSSSSSSSTPVLSKVNASLPAVPPSTSSTASVPMSPSKKDSSPAKPAQPEVKKANEEFKAKFLEQLRLKNSKATSEKKEEKSQPTKEVEKESKPDASSKKSEPPKELPQEISKEAPKPAEKPETSKEEPKEPAESAKPAKPAVPSASIEQQKEETKEIEKTQPNSKQAEKPEELQAVPESPVESIQPKPVAASAPSVDEVKEEAQPTPVKEEPINADSEQTEGPKSSPVADSQEDTKDETAEPLEAASPGIDKTFDMTRFFAQISKATPIKDIYAFPYKEGQEKPDLRLQNSPKNKYSPPFLLQFQPVCQFPVDDEWDAKVRSIIDLVGAKKESRDRGFSRSGSQFGRGGAGSSNAMPRSATLRGEFGSRNGSRGGSKKKMGLGSREKSQRQGSKKPRRLDDEKDNKDEETEAPKQVVEVKPLEKSANRWVPRSQRNKEKEVRYAPDGVTVILEEDDVEAKVKSHLNKLTLDNFDTISAEIIQIANQARWEDDVKTLKQVIELTFAKACDEHLWSSVYAKLCLTLCTDISEDVEDKSQPRPEQVPKRVYSSGLVRKLLLSRCQAEYEKGWSDKLPTNEDGTPLEPEMMSDEYYKLAAAKRRGLGLVRFIGELYYLNLLSEKIIIKCLVDQLSDSDSPSEDTLETLTQLLTTTGAKLDSSNRGPLDFAFEKINHIINNCQLSSRIKFKLMDLCDLRANRWADAKINAGPKTIAEIHQEAEAKRLQEERDAIRRRKADPRSGSSRSNSSRSNSKWGNSNQISSNDISKVGVVRNSSERSLGPFNKQKSKLSSSKLSQQQFTTVPSAGSANSSGASSGQKRAGTPPDEPREASRNIFAALGDHEDEDSDREAEHHEPEPEHEGADISSAHHEGVSAVADSESQA
ncbi:hypothetical protein KL937_000842 [Ogataea polymorpha]|uniref:uncharacterized protein n=1 Tax=Ogataea polymorpha TaxID=460523 RepID=UPI0007F41F8E|nr:uncharacterized protein OGAPODRAFT_16130 [Ogataea polymorpha]KAG7882271.1 hypothetical protein KL937_000842 [Ogataea polymorpha]KAG7891644.1 hypothetical protein KL936_001587 [Ogataea polymorpha]KAG7939901.1 hypothetical protein KL904_000839 [Ogataea polymorpha]OBA16431.1 hypothetical protein OGAPODRAFT_16130 [Ogataea polymorpha]